MSEKAEEVDKKGSHNKTCIMIVSIFHLLFNNVDHLRLVHFYRTYTLITLIDIKCPLQPPELDNIEL